MTQKETDRQKKKMGMHAKKVEKLLNFSGKSDHTKAYFNNDHK